MNCIQAGLSNGGNLVRHLTFSSYSILISIYIAFRENCHVCNRPACALRPFDSANMSLFFKVCKF